MLLIIKYYLIYYNKGVRKVGENKEKETENVKKEEKKSNRLVITLLIILLLGVFFAFGYAIGGTKIITKVNDLIKNEGNKDNTSSNSESTTEKITFTESELEKLIAKKQKEIQRQKQISKFSVGQIPWELKPIN